MPNPARPTVRLNDCEINLEDSSELTAERTKQLLAAAQKQADESCETEEKLAETIALPDPTLVPPPTRAEEEEEARKKLEVPEGEELTAAHVKAILSKTNRKIDGFSNATRHAFAPESKAQKLKGKPKRKQA